ncbi:fructosamine kinase family protein [Pseudogracilibacillus auburnensis]|uniref:Fructosamine-3-kinase n=1 Tax=Pseudogracilibacillus auburnensis TaxID=1494959 RepID=A0A2V3WC64_9BACI|nr:fructosamine kinase family protein [Pseudogracilibacillus auburnensis]PXW86329.1 fructosamine-3-kinase [Pseudogracilibacillus auburnensis]
MRMDNMEQLAKIALENGRDYSGLQTIKKIKGGSINEAFYVRTEDAEFFMKFHANSPKSFFKNEATGLRLIKETDTISVPNYLSYSDQPGNAFLLLEWIEGKKSDETEEILGQKLAELHQSFGRMHGFQTDTYIGLLPQPNELNANWLDYYRKKRLGSQMEQGIEKGLIKDKRRKQLEQLSERLDEWVPSFVEPSHLHGDLYIGNWIVGPGGEPYLVDPSFLYGDRHFEIAYTELFGGFPSKFYESYHESYPLRKDYEDVKPIYQLYYLLAHLNLFGESYGESIDTILDRYVGEL